MGILWNRFFIIAWIYVVVLTGIFKEVQLKGGYVYFEFLCYENRGNLKLTGDSCDKLSNCDPQFTICISNQNIQGSIEIQKCPIYHKVTASFDNQESVCNKPYDNRGELRYKVKKFLSSPFNNQLYVKIEVRDMNGWTESPNFIATFKVEFSQTPSFNSLGPIYQEVKMYRNDYRYANSKVSLSIALALQCDKDLYGTYCMDLCRSTQFDDFHCSKDGGKICKEGWKGSNCDEVDVCLYQLCIEGAKCIELEKEAKCMCNGEIGPQCYPYYNPCIRHPCKNGGLCIPDKTTKYRCQCKYPFQGFRCETESDPCTIEPCHNNATCYIYENNIRQCKCLEGFAGVLCDYVIDSPKMTNSPLVSKQNAVITLIVSFALTLLIVSVILIVHFIRKRREKYYLKNQSNVAVNMSDLAKKTNYPDSAGNEYQVKQTPDAIYGVVNDNDTYAYLMEKNDDYLIPSRPTTPGFASNPGSTVYMDMFGKDDPNAAENSFSNRDNSDLPPLPTRDHKKSRSLKLCVS